MTDLDMPPRFPVRWYTDRENRIRADRIAASTARHAEMLAGLERDAFAVDPDACSIDAVDEAYEALGVQHPDTVLRNLAIVAHLAGRPSFAVLRNGAAQAALGALYDDGVSLAAWISAQAVPSADIAYVARRVIPGVRPVNEPALAMLHEALELVRLHKARQGRAA